MKSRGLDNSLDLKCLNRHAVVMFPQFRVLEGLGNIEKVAQNYIDPTSVIPNHDIPKH
jgi:hypothetical protein